MFTTCCNDLNATLSTLRAAAQAKGDLAYRADHMATARRLAGSVGQVAYLFGEVVIRRGNSVQTLCRAATEQAAAEAIWFACAAGAITTEQRDAALSPLAWDVL
jgi:hypothetical protein